MKLSDLCKFKPVGHVNTSIGKLAVFGISAGDQSKVVGESSLSVKAVPPHELALRLIPYIAHPIDVLADDQGKPDKPSLAKGQVPALKDDDVEAILDIFINDQKHLYQKHEWTRSKNDQGEQVNSPSYGEIEHPREDGESNVDYLHRLYILEEERIKRQMAKLTGLTSAHFSTDLTESINKTLLMGDSISKAVEALRPPKSPSMDEAFPNPSISELLGNHSKPPEIMPSFPQTDYAALARSAEEARWAPFDAVNQRLDKLVEMTATSSEFMVQMNQTQTQIAAEIKASGEEAAKIGKDSLRVTKWGFWLTIVVVALTSISLLIAASSWRASASNTQTANDYAEQMVGGLAGVKEAIEQQSEQQASDRQTIDELQSRIVHLEEILRQFQADQSPDEGDQ